MELIFAKKRCLFPTERATVLFHEGASRCQWPGALQLLGRGIPSQSLSQRQGSKKSARVPLVSLYAQGASMGSNNEFDSWFNGTL